MHDTGPAFRASALIGMLLALGGCSGDRLGGLDWFGSGAPAEQAPRAAAVPPVSLAGRWLLTSPGQGQCHMTFGSATPEAVEGTIAPEGGCPGKFYMSRKWNYDQGGLVMRDHTGKPLAQLSSMGASFEGKATSGEPVTLLR